MTDSPRTAAIPADPGPNRQGSEEDAKASLSPQRTSRGAGLAKIALVVVIGVTTVALGLASQGNPLAMLAPAGAVAGLLAFTKIPLRWSTTALVFLLLALDVTNDGGGIWSTPLVALGDILSDCSGSRTGVKVGGFEVFIVLIFAIAIFSGGTGSASRSGRHLPTPGAVKQILWLYLVGFLFAEGFGIVRGMGAAPWKARYVLHVPLFFALFQSVYGDPLDFAPIGTAVVVAAHVKALLATWVQKVAWPRVGGRELEYATNHGDSVLFAMAILILVAMAIERGRRQDMLRLLLFAPLPLWGMMQNRRRLAWAMLELSLVLFFVVARRRPWKRKVAFVLVVGAPVILLYVGLGWSSTGGGIFGPVRKIRTLVDSKDPSTFWRDIETWNIASTIRSNPLLGTGLGGQYTEYMANDDISAGYPEYREWPHNTVLGLILYMGLIGFIPIWLPYPVAMFLAMRSYRHARTPEEHAAALMCAGAVVCCCSMAWGDTGLHFMQVKLGSALALCVAGKLAISTGAWPARGEARPGGGGGSAAGAAATGPNAFSHG